MHGKFSFLTGLATGYVLGARAGRERYDQIKDKSQEIWNKPGVQDKVSGAGETLKAKAPVAQQKIGDAAKHAAEAAKSKVGGSSSDGTGNHDPKDSEPTNPKLP